jgi:hypothetical protein
MIKIVDGGMQKVWLPIKPAATIYVGSLVCIDQSALDEGVIVRPLAAGASNTTNKDRPLGVCVGTNNKNPLWSSTYLAEYITDPGATGVRSNAAEQVGVEGPWAKGDKIAMVEVQLISPHTILQAPIRNNAIGTALSVLTSTAGNANGLTVTTGACDFTPVANVCSIYCRSGVNAGQYRITDDTSTTVAAWDVEMLKTTAGTGETYVRVPLRTHGVSYVQLGDSTVCSYINASKTPATDYDIIHVVRLDLSVAGHEFAEFMFDQDAFCTARA